MTANMREALEVARDALASLDERLHACRNEGVPTWEAYDSFYQGVAADAIMQIDAALSAVPAPVSEEEVALWKCNTEEIILKLWALGHIDDHAAKRLKDSISRLSREGEWRPIETAPKDMRPVLVFVMANRRPFQEEPDSIHVAYLKRTDTYVLQDDDHSIVDPTHWMPLPSPPGEQQPDPEESIRTRLDDQAVKSSGGVRTSTLEG